MKRSLPVLALACLPLGGCIVVQPVPIAIPPAPLCESPGAGAAYGAALGAGVGALAGSASADAGRGALLGAGIGAVAGAAIASQPCE